MSIELQSFLQGHNFTQSCGPRPLTIGEENEVTSVDGRMSTHSSVSGKSEVSSATPRRTDIDLGYEPEGSASPLPSCERWKLSLHNVLEDREGIRLFKEFLADSKQQEFLECWLACKGFRDFGTKHNHSNNSSCASSTTGPLSSQRTQLDFATLQKRGKLAKKIFNTYFKKDKCVVSSTIQDGTRVDIYKQIKRALQAQKEVVCPTNGGNGELDAGLFDQAQNEIEMNIELNCYQTFLASDLFRQYASQCEKKHMKQTSQGITSHPLHTDNKNPTLSISTNLQPPANVETASLTAGRYLPRLDENLVWQPLHHQAKGGDASSDKDNPMNSTISSSLSQSSLARTAMKQAMANANKQYLMAGDAPDQNHPAYPYYAAPSATKYYVPPASANVSDQASSDATSDTLSVTDSSVDGSSAYSSKKNQKRMMRSQYKRNAAMHCQGEDHFVSLTRRCNYKQEMANLATEYPHKFFAQLKMKLEKVAEDRRKAALEDRRKAALEEAALDDVDDILDNHLERVMKTPIAVDSPQGNHSPPHVQATSGPVAVQQRHRHSPTHGMVHAPTNGSAEMPSEIRRHPQKEVLDPSQTRMSNSDQSTMSRKTDSLRRRKEGKEVAVGMAPNEVPDVDTPIQPVDKYFMINEWIKQSSNNSKPVQPQSLPKRKASATKVAHHMFVNRGTSFPIQAVVTSKANQFQSQPLQPISQDPEMPPLDQPDASTTIEEVKRRLIEEAEKSYVNPMQHLSLNRNTLDQTTSYPAFTNPNPPREHSFNWTPNQGQNYSSNATTLSSGSGTTIHADPATPDKSAKSKPTETTCVYYMPHEQMGYKIHVPHYPVTLGQFKTFLSRKGNFKYYFKQYSPEIAGPVLFEIQKDSDILPLWENTVVAKVEPCST